MWKSWHMASKTARIFRVVLTTSLITLGAQGCGGGSDDSVASSGDWPEEVRSNFLTSCIASAEASGLTEGARDYCECTLARLQDSLTAEEFAAAESAIARGEASGIDLEELAASCL